MDRRIAAIMVGDFVGSTSAMETDEETSVRRIETCLGAVAEVVVRYGGRVFGRAGDGILAEFPSAVNALRAAMEARTGLGGLDGVAPEDMRFGLHLADVMAVGHDLRGDGINLAARIQSAAEPGQIDVSHALYEHVRRVSPCVFDDLGERAFKGVSEPIRVFRVRTAIDRHRFQAAPTRVAEARAIRSNSVAVAPFRLASSADEDQSFLADGLTDDLVLELSRLRSIHVAPVSAARSLGAEEPERIAAALGVRYVLSGSVRKIGPRVRLNLALSDAATGVLVWSERINRPFEELMDVMDEVVARVASTVSGRIVASELAAVRLKRPESMTAYEYYLRGLEHHRMGGVVDDHWAEAVTWFERAIEADPSFGRPHAMWACSASALPDFDFDRGEEKAALALALDPTDPEAHRIMGAIRMIRGDFIGARHFHQRAQELAPNDSYVLGRCAAFHTFAGEPERALELLGHAETLDPFLPVWITEERIAALYALGRHEEMLAVARALPFQTRRTRIYRAAGRMALGEPERARQLIAEALREDPTLSSAYVRSQELFEDKALLSLLIERAVAAGLPERAAADSAAA